MSFAADHLAQLTRFAGQSPLPRIRALHLPPDPAVHPDNRGEFCAVELTDGSLGVAFVLLDDTLRRLHAAGDGLGLVGSDALSVARRYAEAPGLARTLGFATANAISRCLFDRAGFVPPPSSDSIGELDPQAGEAIGMVGFFKPLLKRVTATGARLTVLELNPALVGDGEGYRVTLEASALAGCDKVLATSTILLNDTLESLLTHCRAARRLALIGPSAGCLPDALFRRGVTFLGGAWIHDRAAFVDALRRGEPTGDSAGKMALTPAGWPGFETLLARL